MRLHQRSRGVPLRAWVWLVLGLLLYGGAVATLLVIDLGTAAPIDPLLPDWTPLVLTLVLYPVLALAAFARVSLRAALVATCALCVLRVFLGALSAVLDATIALTPFSDAIVEAFSGVSLLTLLGLAGPPLLLSPLGRVHPRARSARAQARNSARAGHVAAPTPERAAEERPASAESLPAPMVEPEKSAPPAAAPPPISPPRGEDGQPSAMPAAEPLSAPRPPAAESVEDVVRISFARVADQLPTDAFHLPPERVAANLMDAGHLLVPVRLVAPQLGEGLVQVAWSVVAEQFPRQALALSDADIAGRLPDGSLVLPLDEVVRQIPNDLFALSSPTVDVRAIEDFPAPFQPHFPQTGKDGGGETLPVSPPLSTEPKVAPSAAAPPMPEVPAPVPVEPAPTPGATPPPAPSEADLAIVPAASEHAVALQRLGALMRDLRVPLDVGIRETGGVTLFTVVPAGVSEKAIAATAARVLPCLDPQLAGPLEQVTLRSAETVLVLTPLASRPPYDALLAAALPVGAPLALLEQQALRAVSSLARPAPSGRLPETVQAPRIDLREIAVPPHVRAIAESLRAFGALSPVVLSDEAGARCVYVFLPPRLEPRALGELASQFHAALSGAEIGPLISIVLRLGGHRVVVRALDGGRGALLVAAASGERPGLVRREVERVASRLVERGA